MSNARKNAPLPRNPRLKKRARELRRAGMLHEVLVWWQLQARRLNGLKFNRQHIIGHYVADFYCADRKVVIELDGDSHEGKAEYDRRREQRLVALGLSVIHISAAEVLRNLEGVAEFLRGHPWLQPRAGEDGNATTPRRGRHPSSEEGN